MVGGYELLADLNDTLGQNFMNNLKDKKNSFKLGLRKRNDSILAHGFTPISKGDASNLLDQLLKYINICYPEWESKLGSATFPKIKL